MEFEKLKKVIADIEIPAEEAEKIHTVREAVDLIKGMQG